MNRRSFFKSMLQLTGAALIAPTLFKVLGSENAHAAGPMPLIDPKDSTAKAVGYIEDFKKAPKAKGNKCSTCSFYKKVEMRGGKEVGTCLIFPAKVVYADAYCNSWNKKA